MLNRFYEILSSTRAHIAIRCHLKQSLAKEFLRFSLLKDSRGTSTTFAVEKECYEQMFDYVDE